MVGGLVKILYWCCLAIALMCGIAALTITVAIVTNKLPDSQAWMAAVFFAAVGGAAWIVGSAASIRGHPPAARDGTEGEEVNEAKRVEIEIPKIAGASNLTIGRWFKRVGDPVSTGEPIVEIDTYNLTHELQASAAGILSSVMVKDGGSVEPGTVIGTIDQV
jgi:biotin carboxyl carrier protein